MCQRILLLLACFYFFSCIGFSQIKVLKSTKFVDTNAIFYKTYQAQCAKWMLSNAQIEFVLSNSEKIDGYQNFYYYSNLPAVYTGEVLVNGKPAKFSINAGALVSISFIDSSVARAYNRPDYKKYFIEGRDTDFDVNEKFEVDSWYSFAPHGIEVRALWSNHFISTYIDNHSPSWVNKQALLQTKYKKSDAGYSTTTVDGKRIQGEVYIIDTMRLGKFTVTSVPVYLIDDETSKEAEAVMGDDILSKAVLGVMFKRQRIILSDEVPDLGESYELKSSFTKEGISVEVQFANNVRHTMFLDLGFNGGIMIPEAEFKAITRYNKYVQRRTSRMTTANGYQVAETSHASDYLTIDGKQYSTILSTNRYVKEKLLGVMFFQKFDFLIIDYKHKKVLVSKN